MERKLGVSLLAAGLPGLAEPVSRTSLAAAHPLWSGDLETLGSLPDFPADAADAVVCGPCSSTMDVARELVAQGRLGQWGSVIAPDQTAGRGQLRRHWISRPGNLLATLVCPPAPPPWNDLRPLVFGRLFADALSSLGDDLKFVFITSKATVEKALSAAEEAVTVTPSAFTRCARCWHYRDDVGSDPAHPQICGRCASNLFGEGESRKFA